MKRKSRVEDGGKGREKQRGHYCKERSYSTHQHTLFFFRVCPGLKREMRERKSWMYREAGIQFERKGQLKGELK